MSDPTLESVLASKYCIKENLLAEGKFVAMLDDDKADASLVSLGISEHLLVVAGVILGGDDVDYDLISLAPLSKLNINIYNIIQNEITVQDQSKPRQLFQLCSSEDKKEVWAGFVDKIRRVNANKHGDALYVAPLHSVGSGSQLSSSRSYDCIQPSLLSAFYPCSSYMSIPHSSSSFIGATSGTKLDHSASAYSLRDSLPPQADRRLKYSNFDRRHSVDFGDIRFDNFVNDSRARHSEYTRKYVTCSWTDLADISGGSSEAYNVSNNFADGASTPVSNTGEESYAKSGRSFLDSNRIFKAFKFLCCRNPK